MKQMQKTAKKPEETKNLNLKVTQHSNHPPQMKSHKVDTFLIFAFQFPNISRVSMALWL